MDPVAQRILAFGIIGVAIAGVSAWMHIKGQDGSGWGFVAFCFLLTSCSQD